MVFLNYTAMQMTAKIVYYGPGLCGKTTNLAWIHGRTAPGSRGDMVSLETEADRTLFFDLLPLDVGVIGGMKVRLQLYTVPGQVFYNATRRLVLKGVDGVVFVADSQAPAAEPNEESLSNLKQNLEELGLDLHSVPLVFQYNKRDLRNILPIAALQQALNPAGAPSFEAAAVHGVGVFETLKEISRLSLDSIRAKVAEERHSGVAGLARRAPAPDTPAAAPPPPTAEPPAADPALMEPLAVEFAEEDTDKLSVRAVRTRGSLDVGKELEKLRAITAESKMRAADCGEGPGRGQALPRPHGARRGSRPADREEGLAGGPGAPLEGPHRPAHPPRVRPRRPRGNPARRGASHPGAHAPPQPPPPPARPRPEGQGVVIPRDSD